MKQEFIELLGDGLICVIQQGAKSVRASVGCRYRGPNGLACAIGHIMRDDVYNPNLEGISVIVGEVQHAAFGRVLGAGETSLAWVCQMAHDNSRPERLRDSILEHLRGSIVDGARLVADYVEASTEA